MQVDSLWAARLFSHFCFSENCKQTRFDMTPLCYDTTDCSHSLYIPRVTWYAGWIKLRLFLDIRICELCELIWWINPYTFPAKSKFNLGNFTAWYMIILVPPFRSGALYNFCYNAILLYLVFHLHHLPGIGECLNMDKTNWMVSLSVFIFQWLTIRTYFCYINIVCPHPAVWNTFTSTAKLCHVRFVCTELFVY